MGKGRKWRRARKSGDGWGGGEFCRCRVRGELFRLELLEKCGVKVWIKRMEVGEGTYGCLGWRRVGRWNRRGGSCVGALGNGSTCESEWALV